MNIRLLVAAGLLCSVPLAEGEEATWLQWRGAGRDGHVKASWPEKLTSDNFQQQWRAELGPSYSGPIITDDRVFVTETQDERREVVHAFDRQSGKELWKTGWEGALTVPFFARANGDWIRATPASDGKRLYVAGMRDVLVCLDTDDGKVVWEVDFTKRNGTPLPAFGFASSPLLDGDALYVQAGAALVKLDKRTGKTLWRVLEDGGGMWGSAFSSPGIGELHGKRQLLVQTRQLLAGVDLKSGDVLWKHEVPAFRGMNILTPTVYKNSVVTSSYGGKAWRFDLAVSDDKWQLTENWENKVQGYMSSPVVVGDHLYLHLRNQRFTCINLQTGESCWTTEPFGKYWSLVTDGQSILALDERGVLRLIRANPDKFDLRGEVTISDQPCWGHLSVAGSQVVVRELKAVSSYTWAAGK